MKYGLDIAIDGEYANPHVIANLASEAERAGWDGCFVWGVVYMPDSQKPLVDPWVAITSAAMATERIQLGVMVNPLACQQPWQIARTTVSLDHVSNGRLIFGAGAGWDAVDFSIIGEEPDLKVRGDRLDEGLEILTGLWTGEPFDFHGKHFQARHAQFLPKPIQSPRIPIWIAGNWPNRRPFRRASKWDGVYVGSMKANNQPLTCEELKEVIAFVQARRERTDHFDVVFAGPTSHDCIEGARIVQPYIEAGITWWLEVTWGSPSDMAERIRSGPPKL